MDVQLCECIQHREVRQAVCAKWLSSGAQASDDWRMAGASLRKTVSAGRRKARTEARSAAGASEGHMNPCHSGKIQPKGRRRTARKLCTGKYPAGTTKTRTSLARRHAVSRALSGGVACSGTEPFTRHQASAPPRRSAYHGQPSRSLDTRQRFAVGSGQSVDSIMCVKATAFCSQVSPRRRATSIGVYGSPLNAAWGVFLPRHMASTCRLKLSRMDCQPERCCSTGNQFLPRMSRQRARRSGQA